MLKLEAGKHPVGTRALMKNRQYSGSIFEATVAEWAPSGNLVKLQYITGAMWTDDMPYVVEVLPLPVQAEEKR